MTPRRACARATTPARIGKCADFAGDVASRHAFQKRLHDAGFGDITTEIVYPAPPFYYAEDEHQQYLAKHPSGYCGLGGTGVSCQLGLTDP